jgi:hypothetical protein
MTMTPGPAKGDRVIIRGEVTEIAAGTVIVTCASGRLVAADPADTEPEDEDNDHE